MVFYLNKIGIKRCVITKPPIKKPITATNDGNWKSLKPEMACPDVQPFAQHSPLGDTPFWYIGKSVTCGNQKQYKLQSTIMGWFDQKLKDQAATNDLPELCVDKSPIQQLKDLDATTHYTLNKTWIEAKNSHPIFVPIQTMTEVMHITGTPKLALNIETQSKDSTPTLFISVAIKSKKTGKYVIFNDQTAALNPSKKQAFDQVVFGSKSDQQHK